MNYICNMIDIVSFKTGDRADLEEQANHIRRKVFVEEQHVDPALEYDQHEAEALHYLLFVEEGNTRRDKTGAVCDPFFTP